MGFLSKLRPDPTQGQPEIERSTSIPGDEKGLSHVDTKQSRHIAATAEEDSDNEDELVHKDMQLGIQKAEAMAQVWPKWALIFTYVW